MHWLKILTPLCAASVLTVAAPFAQAQNSGDAVLLDMQKAFRARSQTTLTQLLPQASGHPLEAWAAYWELKNRLETSAPDEIQAFLTRYAGSYQEDRMRNDWLLLLGKQRDWSTFGRVYPQFRMRDDKSVTCYALLADALQGRAAANVGQQVRDLWMSQKDADDGCTTAAGQMYASKLITEADVWRRARVAAENNRQKAARDAVAIVAPEVADQVALVFASPAKYLAGSSKVRGRERKELALLALIRMAANDPDGAAGWLEGGWGAQLNAEERNWAWAVAGKQAAFKLSPDANTYFGKVRRNEDLSDELLGWKVRAALRAGDWKAVRRAVDAMGAERLDPAWVYWKAKSILASRPNAEEKAEAQQLLEKTAGSGSFYEQLALEDLGQRISVPPVPAALTAEEKAAARANPGLRRSLYAISIGLRSEGVREWNYSTNLHQSGGMDDRELYAAADLACERQVWDRCINTSERTKSFADWKQRFPMPYHDTVLSKSRNIGLDPAYVYGLIRQESRFIMDARSGVGASGLMQVMPATATWTARKIGMTGFTPGMINDRETNITIGTAYLKLALDDFDGSMAMAAAGYNAGPGRPRNWRNGPTLDAAIWAENVPFTETRDYVKKVLSNTTNYAALITGQPQSLRERLGTVGPRPSNEPAPMKDLP
ncbi:lytic transglycosylase domain-containing protein [Comamonas sp. Y33R10-2]|uniref:lytic transglycosylase domain-containing protein n=1 Tax=Comamonas sp. Y33R10-2 TaxID=2853257 RepID=UPI001C5C937E|nr:lytic transglycosylase domain-containing protein [Comamonas sp. Y33R10-2]QXZ09276.1 lytic transglycosylase domain-containing protein [Comamonas sp. Y33R10-2]